MNRRYLTAFLLWLLLFACLRTSATDAPRPSDLYTHDPSTMVKDKDEYWIFVTGNGIRSRHSKDLQSWQEGPAVFTNTPTWTTNMLPGFRGYIWAPDIIKIGEKFLLYYSVSSWGSQKSAIGMVTNRTLDPSDPRFHWSDCGPVIQSTPGDDFNAIDPSVMRNSNGNLWLAFGSFWSGIKLVQLDPETGRRLHANAPPSALAWKEQIEAPCLYEHAGRFYLFVNWGLCCRGTNSTYNIRVARSDTITGPYVDKDGVDMLSGGGSLLLGSQGRFIGPGHAGLCESGGTNWLTYHYYDADNRGRPALSVRQLHWSTDGWPEAR